MKNRILALTKYGRMGASSRLRTYQYVPYWEENGFAVSVKPLFSNDYLEKKYNGSFFYGKAIKGYLRRYFSLLDTSDYTLVWIEKELFPMVPFLFEKLLFQRTQPVVVDYDDAIFHNYDLHPNPWIRNVMGDKIDRLMAAADAVTAGNPYLKKRAQDAGAKRVLELPTVIDLNRYIQSKSAGRKQIVIGWIGSPTTAKYLDWVRPVLRDLQKKYDVAFRVVGAPDLNLEGVDVQKFKWREDTEVDLISDFDIGIMPLDDTPWARGKCGYKLIQYMGCAKAVVASPVGVNSDIVEHGESGYLAESREDWYHSLEKLIKNPTMRENMGNKGYRIVKNSYQLEVTAPRLVQLFRELQR